MDVPQLDPRQSVRRSDGLEGEWLGLEELARIPPFRSIKKVKLNNALRSGPGEAEPAVKAAVRREYQPGEVICTAGEFGSTAFLLLEGRAVARVPERAEARPVPGRGRRTLARLARMFERRTRRRGGRGPRADELGEISRYGTLVRDRPPPEVEIGPGDLFGVDTCINFYPREATVRAVEPCVAVEMLRSLLDTLRESSAGDVIENAYATAAIRQEIHGSPAFAELPGAALDEIAAASSLLTNDSDAIDGDVIYREGEPAEALYLVRAGTVKLSQRREGEELMLAYLGRGAVFGLENLMPVRPTSTLTLRCVSHPKELPAAEIRGVVSLGRKADCTVRFPADRREVGGLHCRLEEREGDVYLVDNDSKNFTLLNGERIREAILAAGDVISIVDFVFEVIATPVVETGAETPCRRATAAGLDSFEIVRVPAPELKRAARQSPAFVRGATAAGGLLQRSGAGRPSHLRDLVDLNLYNSQNVLLIDLDRCTRCDECVRACAAAHDGVARFTRDGPRFGKYLVTMACRSCTDPKCMVGCPVGSIRRKDSLEIHIEDWCIGCQRCANQCPFGNINMVELFAEAPEPAPALRATVCDLCSGYDGPSCVYACPHDAAIRVDPSAYLSPLDK
jgi:Fe-S-cluster-containing hydrogenase component 2/CRP-like cAMP-binding protein